ncbi:MAG TPA: hypothetical protein VMX75_07365 [Spirochaetia bacterium]|nr:hypothetical protein [Spirochaetia bacterium]
MMKHVLSYLFSVLALFSASAQEKSADYAVQAIMDEALKINITARILPSNSKVELNVEKSKLTIPGRPVAVLIKGENILINAILTPYESEAGKLTLVAQGQIWYSDSQAEKQIKYLSSLKSIPISLGEKIFFFPLGVQDDLKAVDSFNLVLEIEIIPYKSP